MYYISVSNGLLEGDHQKKMGNAVWQFMWCLDKLTIIKSNGEGKVLGGKPINLKDLSGASERTNSRNLNKLQKLGYLKLVHTPYGISIIVYKAKKIFNKRSDISGVPKRSDISGVPLTKCGVPNKIIQLDKTAKTLAKTSFALKVKKKMKIYDESKHSDSGIPEINYETRENITTPKPQTKKYPNALVIYSLFGKYPLNWKINKTQLQAAENLFTERGSDQIIKALLFYRENKEEEFCPIINSPYDLDSKWSKLISFKKRK